MIVKFFYFYLLCQIRLQLQVRLINNNKNQNVGHAHHMGVLMYGMLPDYVTICDARLYVIFVQ